MTTTEGNTDQSETESQTEVKDELSTLIEEGGKTTGIDDVVSYVREQREENANTKFRADMDAAVKVVSEAVPEEMRKLADNDLIEGYLHKKASDDQSVKDAFINRYTNPSAWAETQAKLAKDFSKRFEEIPDEKINADREAVIASAKTQGGKQEAEELTEETVKAMSKSDFADLQRKHGLTPYGA